MKKKYITRVPDQVGAFLRASEIVSEAGGNIARVSYNRSIDVNTIFLDVSGTPEQISDITRELTSNGYIAKDDIGASVILLELKLPDVPGGVLPVLKLFDRYSLNITYMSSSENGTAWQNFKLGIQIDSPSVMNEVLDRLSEICEFKILTYDNTEKYLDNTVFYMSFADKVSEKLGLGAAERKKLMVYSNMIIQELDDKNKPVHKTFEYIGKFAETIAKYKGANFVSRLYNISLADDVIMYVVEPACGSNTYVLQKGRQLLFVDCGFACYRNEMEKVLSMMIPDYDSMSRELIITHPDIDHVGLADIFPRIYVTKTAYDNFLAENEGKPNIRESKKEHLPYCKLSKIMTGYRPLDMGRMVVIGERAADSDKGLVLINEIELIGEKFSIYQGNGGHCHGEIVIVSDRLGVMFTGDIMVNVRGFSKEQYEFNLLAPYLMTSVNLNSQMANEERAELIKMFDMQDYYICCGHGAVIQKGDYRGLTH